MASAAGLLHAFRERLYRNHSDGQVAGGQIAQQKITIFIGLRDGRASSKLNACDGNQVVIGTVALGPTTLLCGMARLACGLSAPSRGLSPPPRARCRMR